MTYNYKCLILKWCLRIQIKKTMFGGWVYLFGFGFGFFFPYRHFSVLIFTDAAKEKCR